MVCFILQPPPGVDREPVSFIAPGPCPPSQSQRTTDLCSLRRGGESIRGSGGWAPMASGGSHPTSDARLGDFALSRRQNSDKRLRREPLPSDLFFLIRSKSTSPSVSISKRHNEARAVVGVRTSTWVWAAGCRRLPPLSSVAKTPTQKKRMKERKKERRGERRPLCPGAYLMESNLLTSLGWAPWNKLPDVVFFPFSHLFRSAFHNSLPNVVLASAPVNPSSLHNKAAGK